MPNPKKPGGQTPIKKIPFKVGDEVIVVKPNAPSVPATIVEVDRMKKGKQFDIDVELIDGTIVHAHAHQLKKKSQQTIAGIPITPKPNNAPPSPADAIAADAEKKKRKWDIRYLEPTEKKLPNCARCKNGNFYHGGSQQLYKDGYAKFFELDLLCKYAGIILVPAQPIFGRVSKEERLDVEICDRCRSGSITKIDGKSQGYIDHISLKKKGIVAVIFLPEKRSR